jgi:hypothetical protein
MFSLLRAKVRRALVNGNVLSFGKFPFTFPFGKSRIPLSLEVTWPSDEGNPT